MHYNISDQSIPLSSQFADAIGLSKNKFHIVGSSMGGHIAGVYSVRYKSDVQSLTLLCPAGIKADKPSTIMQVYQKEGKMYLLPESVDDFKRMMEFVMHKRMYVPRFVLGGIIESRKSSIKFYKKGKTDLISIILKRHNLSFYRTGFV